MICEKKDIDVLTQNYIFGCHEWTKVTIANYPTLN